MSQLLRDAIREAAESTPGYDVLDSVMALGRRRRRRATLVGAIAATAAVLLLIGAVVPLLPDGDAAPVGEPPSKPALPDRIGPPGLFPSSVTARPPGPASLIFMEASDERLSGRIVTVGAVADTYRVIEAPYGEPGYTALLSPAGDRVAYPDKDTVVIADLHTGQLQTLSNPEPDVDKIAPAAWLPDGHGLVVMSIRYARDPTIEGIVKRLGILDLDTGAYQRFAEATWPIAPGGLSVAVSPDGRRIAYQFSDFITVYDRITGEKRRITLADGYTALAGKGAWTPDGRSLAIVGLDDSSAGRWHLRFLDPDTGAERDPSYRPSVSGVALIRLVGWTSGGSPVVVASMSEYVIASFSTSGSTRF